MGRGRNRVVVVFFVEAQRLLRPSPGAPAALSANTAQPLDVVSFGEVRPCAVAPSGQGLLLASWVST